MTRDWLAAPAPWPVPTMLNEEEQRILYWLGAQARGDIVDLGAFLGGSTLMLARGAQENPRRPTVHSYDMFICPKDPYSQGLIGHGRRPGDSVRDLYEANISPVRDRVRIYEGDVGIQDYEGAPIDVLFVDIAKTADLNDHILATHFTHLTGAGAFIVHQDYNHGWVPWVHLTAHLLRPWCTYLADTGGTRLVRVTADIPAEALKRCEWGATGHAEKLSLLRAERDGNETAYGAAMVQLGIAWLSFLEDGAAAAEAELAHPLLDQDYLPAQVEQMRCSIKSFGSSAGVERYHREFFAA